MKDPFGALYIHVPFCVRRCAYCDFHTAAVPAGSANISDYASKLAKSVDLAGRAGLLNGVRTVYIGGGTPTFAGEDALREIMGAVARWVDPGELSEYTVEANPDSLNRKIARLIRGLGASRLSLGVQSLDNRVLARLGRVHDADSARAALDVALDAFDNVSVDVICGAMGQDAESLRSTVEELAGIGISHMSVYPLKVEEGTPLLESMESGAIPEPDDDVQADHMLLARSILLGRGFEHYEVANYARPGRESIHNEAYWTGVSYLGLGDGASSMMSVADAPEVLESDALNQWTAGVALELSDSAYRIRASALGGASVFEQLTRQEALCEDAMLSMRMRNGISAGRLAILQREVSGIAGAVRRVMEEGLAYISDDGSLVPTMRGWLMGNELYGELWSCAGD